MTLAGIATLLTWGAAAAAGAVKPSASNDLARQGTKYVPKGAVACEWATTRANAPRYCKRCNERTKIGASEAVTVQVGGCDLSNPGLTPVCQFTAAGMECFKPIAAPSLEVGNFEADAITVGDITADSLTVGDLTVTGISTHAGLETFNGGIAVNDISPIGDGEVTIDGDVSVPGELTVGDLVVTGTSTHDGLETFYGDIETDVIYSTDRADVSVMIPGSGIDSTQIGPNGKRSVCVCVCV